MLKIIDISQGVNYPMTMRDHLQLQFNIVIYPAPDLPGEWVAHCLELDFIAQGPSASQALETITEQIEIVSADNLKSGRPMFEYRSAPREVWDMLDKVTPERKIDKIIRIERSLTENTGVVIDSHVASAR